MNHKAILEAVFERAKGRRVFGYDSETGRGGEMTSNGRCLIHGATAAEQRRTAAGIDRVCVEGEKGIPWQPIPKGE